MMLWFRFSDILKTRDGEAAGAYALPDAGIVHELEPQGVACIITEMDRRRN